MKKIFLAFLTLVFAGVLFAQSETPPRPVQAQFKYNDEGLKRAKQSNNITVYFSNLADGAEMNRFQKALNNYSEFYTMSIGPIQPSGERECHIILKDASVKFSIFKRFLLSNNIREVIFDGKMMGLEEFFGKGE